MTIDPEMLRLSDPRCCGFKPDANGRIICIVHDDDLG
jgi:hypothetical protein